MPKVFIAIAAMALFGVVPAQAEQAPAPLEWIEPAQVQSVEPSAGECCRTCRKGKACGDSCIARDKDCHQPPGCACDA
jgi:hypothetical protein